MAKKANKRVSSKDVAKAAGVSQSTVSRVYNESGIPVSEDKKKKVLEVAERLGYRPSLIARSLNQQATRMIGIVIRHFSSAVYMNALEMFTRKFQEAGYATMLFNIPDEEGVEKNLQTALEYQVDGLVITSAALSSPLVEGCLRFNTPVFLFNRVSDGVRVNSVCHDNVEGGEKIAEYLITRGHNKLVYIAGEKSSSTNRDRQNGFFRKAESSGISDIPIIDGDFTYDSGMAAGQKLLESKVEFDAVFCVSDYMAMGFYDYIRLHSDLKIPEDFSLVGFDGGAIYNEEIYPITTYQQPFERMVEKTVQLMIQKINNFSSDPVHYMYSGKIVDRGSVANRN